MLRLLLAWVLALGGCKKTYSLHYRTTADLNSQPGAPGQPVLVGLYVLDDLPEGLETAACSSFISPEAALGFLDPALLKAEEPISLVPTERSEVNLPRRSGARWLMIVPFYEDKCREEADAWSLLRLTALTRHRSIELSASSVILPWERRPWRQRGCVSGESSHVYWRVCD